MTGASAELLEKHDLGDRREPVGALDHVDDGEAGNSRSGKGLHLDSGAISGADRHEDLDEACLGIDPDVDIDTVDRQRVAQRDEIRSSLRCRDRRDASNRQGIALGHPAAEEH